MANVAIRNIRKSYGKTQVIHGIDLKVEPGEFIVLVGPSGCGKSTLLRMIAGLEEITSGEIQIAGRRVNELEPRERDIAMVFQNYALYPHMTVYNNMAYGLRNRGYKKDVVDQEVRRAAETLQIGDLLDRRPGQLSGGQRQRVAMGRCIVRHPSVFLFDEPLSNLDAKLRVQMRLEIRKLHQSQGVTSVYVTHDQVEAMTLADRLVVMNAGVAEQIGTPLEVYDRPASTFVADFIGSPSMNFLNAQVIEHGKALHLPDGRDVPLPVQGLDPEALENMASVTVGVRPENLKPIEDKGGGWLRLKVLMSETLGADTLVHGTVGDAQVTARLPGAATYAPDSLLAFGSKPEHTLLFDAGTGKRIDASASPAPAATLATGQ